MGLDDRIIDGSLPDAVADLMVGNGVLQQNFHERTDEPLESWLEKQEARVLYSGYSTTFHCVLPLFLNIAQGFRRRSIHAEGKSEDAVFEFERLQCRVLVLGKIADDANCEAGVVKKCVECMKRAEKRMEELQKMH